ncbi:MAG: hypothetical protein CSA49_05510 [Gammaproteobacteria bacterium]|nr:MAG: hypothetical protein CSA49_05510 [Gammaproteobacteria bacterium]
MFKSTFVFLVIFFVSGSVLAGDGNTRFIYSSFEFYVPSGATVVGFHGGSDSFAFFRYGNEKTKHYLAFTDMTNEATDYGCSAKEFYGHLAGLYGPSTCSKQEIESFKKVFVQGAKVGAWLGDEFTSFYFCKDDQAFLFIFAKGKIVKIDTDYLSESALRNIVKKYI